MGARGNPRTEEGKGRDWPERVGEVPNCRRWWWTKDEAALEARTGVHGMGRGAAKAQEADEVPHGRLCGSSGDEWVTARMSRTRPGMGFLPSKERAER